MNINGQELNWSYETANQVCKCGHIRLQHVHCGGFWCGTPDNGKECGCAAFEPIEPLPSIEQLFTDIVNNLCRLDMKYTFTTEEYDEMLERLRILDKTVRAKLAEAKV